MSERLAGISTRQSIPVMAGLFSVCSTNEGLEGTVGAALRINVDPGIWFLFSERSFFESFAWASDGVVFPFSHSSSDYEI